MSPEQEVLASIAKLLHGVLPDGPPGSPDRWSVEMVLEPGAVPARPYVLVEQAGETLTAGTTAAQEITMVVAAQFLLAPRATRRETHDAAMELRDLLWRAVKYGPDPEAPRSTPDRIPRWRFSDRLETHRVSVTGTGGSFVLSIDDGDQVIDVAALAPTVTAAQLATAVEVALEGAGYDVDSGDIESWGRGAGLWDLRFGGQLAGVRIGEPSVDAALLTAPSGVTPAGSAEVLLQGAAAPWRAPNDFIRVAPGGLTVTRPMPDPDDPRMFSVGMSVRCTFVRGPRLPSSYRVIQGINSSF